MQRRPCVAIARQIRPLQRRGLRGCETRQGRSSPATPRSSRRQPQNVLNVLQPNCKAEAPASRQTSARSSAILLRRQTLSRKLRNSHQTVLRVMLPTGLTWPSSVSRLARGTGLPSGPRGSCARRRG
jgi:hypothetical protein